MELIDIVNKLIGNIEPIGDTANRYYKNRIKQALDYE